MELVPIHKRVIGLDVHQAQITACAILEEADGETRIEQRQFGAFKKDRRLLAAWTAALDPDEVVMESTGIYWKSPYAALEAVGIRATVVNARHVKQVPGAQDRCRRRPMAGHPGPCRVAARVLRAAGQTARTPCDLPATTEAGQTAHRREEPHAQSAHRCGYPPGGGRQ